MRDYNLNVTRKGLDNGLNNVSLMGGKYIYIQSAPENANIQVGMGNSSNDKITLTQGKSITLPLKVDNFYMNADAVLGGTVEIIVSDSESFKIDDTPSFAFNESAKNALRFAPRGSIEYTIANGATQQILKDGNTAIDFHATEFLDVSINGEAPTRQMLEQIINLDYIESVEFKNNSGTNATLTVWSM
ncbi:MAG: hypothetical protein GQ570_12170 [Helicobacteraceae bacterium]|nr:hypothetical protein [Helicobacteraceae bacterium]